MSMIQRRSRLSLEQMGYQPTEDRKMADIILLNTCAIRENDRIRYSESWDI